MGRRTQIISVHFESKLFGKIFLSRQATASSLMSQVKCQTGTCKIRSSMLFIAVRTKSEFHGLTVICGYNNEKALAGDKDVT